MKQIKKIYHFVIAISNKLKLKKKIVFETLKNLKD